MYNYYATVLRVVDGDTVDFEVDLGFHIKMKMKCRLAFINAPEMNTDEGKKAKVRLTELLPVGKMVEVKTIRDRQEKYGRYLAIVYDLGMTNFDSMNRKMVDEGFAVTYLDDGKLM